MLFILILCNLTFAKVDYELLDKIDSVYEFTEVVNIENTDVKNQNKTGTCWSFAGNSFIESELLRLGKGQHDLSEMFVVRMMYPEKADNFVRFHGKAQFGQGALSHDLIHSIEKYGIVPEEVYSGESSSGEHNHSEMFGILNDIVNRVVNTNPNDRTNKWKDAFDAVLDSYIGTPKKEFEYRGKKYTPKSFAESLGIKANDYVDFTSFTHHDFYDKFILEVPDNFSRGFYHNVKVNEMLEIAENALKNGFSVDWGADVSEDSFNSDNGLAINPKDMKEIQKNKEKIKWDSIYVEREINQELRQEDFDNYLTQDDHGMHIVGIVKDKLDRKYFIVKNSWGSKLRGRDGFLYVSYSYFMHKTTSISVHKDAIPNNIKSKLKL
jgi:bleomycin hydrolase